MRGGEAAEGLEVIPPLKVTPHVERVMKNSPSVSRQFLPSCEENGGVLDPLGEEKSTLFGFFIKKHPDRGVLILTEACPVLCRFCNRKRFFGSTRKLDISTLDRLCVFLKKNGVFEVILSGGEPFLLDDAELFEVMSRLKEAGVKVLRFSTRAPFTIPDRFDGSLGRLISRFSPVWVAVHVNHPDEVTEEFEGAIKTLRDGGAFLLSQSVLLKGVNDRVSTLEELFRSLVCLGVKPYYLFMCDDVQGASHFKVSPDVALSLMEGMIGRISGLCVPFLAVDGECGKVPLVPNYVVSKGSGVWRFRDGEGRAFTYRFS